MRKSFYLAMLAGILSADVMARPATTIGYSASSPATWTSPTSATTPVERTVEAYYAYNTEERKWDSDFEDYVYYAKVEVPYGNAFTIWTTSTNCWSMSINTYDTDAAQYYTTLDYFEDWDGNQRYSIDADGWADNDAQYAKVPFLVEIHANHLSDRVTVRYQLAVVADSSIPTGDTENPELITIPGEGTRTFTRTFPNDRYGIQQSDYYFSALLEQGHTYVFRTTSGTSTFPASIYVNAGSEIVTNPVVVAVAADAYDSAVRVTPLQTGLYDLNVHSYATSFSFSSEGTSGRLPREHDIEAVLTPGTAVQFAPGCVVAENSGYADDVIDECLFSFDAASNATFRITTDGARTNVLLRLYDANGVTLAETSERSAADLDAFLVWRFDEAGTYYVGVCEKFADYATGATPTKRAISILLEDVGAEAGQRLDAWDPGDDETAGATALTPALTAMDAEPARIDETGSGPHRLSATDVADFFAFAARTDFTYRVQLVTDDDFSTQGWFLKPDFITADGTSLEPRFSSGFYSFVPPAAGTCYLRVAVATTDASGVTNLVPGADSPDYTVHACAYAPDADDYGYITAVPKGPSAENVRWWFASDASVQYPAGVYAFAKGDVEIAVSDVQNFSTPSNFTVHVASQGAYTDVVATYKDSFDPGDDVRSGAVPLSIANEPLSIDRTMWAASASGPADTNDWFMFESQEGVYYEFRFDDVNPADTNAVSGTPAFYLYDYTGALLASGTNALSWGASAFGTNYLLVAKAGAELCCGLQQPDCDCAYTFSAWSVDVGSVRFEQPETLVSNDAQWVELSVFRTSSEGAVSVNWGTVSDSAVAGTDYVAVNGVLTWADGDAAAKTVRVKLIPPLRHALGGDRTFAVRLWPAEPGEGAGDGNYEAVIGAPQSAAVTIQDAATDVSSGKVSFCGWGDSAAAFSDPDHPEITVAPGQDVRLWISRTDGTKGTLGVAASTYGAAADAGALVSASATWESGESSDKWVGLRIGEDVSEPTTLCVRLDPAAGSAVSFGARRVVVRIDPEAAAPETDEQAELGHALAPFAGRYTVALVPESGAGPSLSVANGWLALLLETNGTATVEGRLPDGTAVQQTADVSFDGDALAPADGVAMVTFTNALSGSLCFCMDEEGVPVADAATGDLRTADASETPLVPVGGLWDAEVSVQALFAGSALTYVAGATSLPVEANGDELATSGNVSIALDKPTGVLTVGGAASGTGVLLMAADERSGDWPYVAYGALSGGAAFMIAESADDSPADEYWSEDLPVLVTFEPNGATAGQVFTTSIVSFPGAAEVASYVSSDFARAGYEFAGWRAPDGSLVQPGDIVFVGAFDATYTAMWRPEGLSDAAGDGVEALSDLSFAAGDTSWYITALENGGQALRSGMTTNSTQTSVMTATATAAGRFSFSWSCVCDEIAYAWCAFTVNGEEIGRIGGTTAWTNLTANVKTGDALAWTFAKKSGAYSYPNARVGSDCIWVNNMAFGAEVQTVPVRYDIGEGAACSVTSAVAVVGQPFGELPTPTSDTRRFTGWQMEGEPVSEQTVVPDVDCVLVAQWDYFVWTVSFDANGADNPAATPLAVSNYEHQAVQIPGSNGLVKAGYAFQGWSDGMGGVWDDEPYVVTATNITLKAVWSLAGLDGVLGNGAASFAFDLSGDAEWFVTDDNASEGAASMRSGAIGKGASSVLSATARSAGTLSFDWACACDEITYAWCAFAVNGVERSRIGGSKDWTAVEVDVAAGDVLTWTYAKGSMAYDVGQDCAWVDNFSFGRKTTVRFVAEGGDPAETNVVAFAGEPIGELPDPTWTDWSLDYWADPTGGVVTASWTVPEDSVTLTAVKKAKEWRVTYDLAGGTAVTATNESYAAGAAFALPGADSATKEGYALAGWTDGSATYAPGAVRTVPGGADLAFTAVWQLDYASALDCKDKGLVFLSGGDAEWTVQTDKVSEGTSAVRSGVIGGSGQTAAAACSSWIETTVVGSGSFAFDWAVSCDDGFNGQKYAWVSCSVNGEEQSSIYGRSDASWRSVTLDLPEGTNVVRWTYAKIAMAYNQSSNQAGEDRAWIDNVVWTPDVPPAYEFTVSWAADAGVLGAMYSIEAGEQNVAASNGEAVAVPEGKTITVVGIADSNNWYYVSSGEGTFGAEGATTVTAARRDPATPVTAAEVGLATDGAFGDADSAEVAKVMAWALANGKTVSDVNAMAFSASGDPADTDAAAYLLNCAPTEAAVGAAAAGFKVTSFSADGEGNIVIAPADGSAYGNGTVELRYAETPTGPFSADRPEKPERLFIRIYLVK